MKKQYGWWEYLALPAACLYFFLRGNVPLMGISLILFCVIVYYRRKNNG